MKKFDFILLLLTLKLRAQCPSSATPTELDSNGAQNSQITDIIAGTARSFAYTVRCSDGTTSSVSPTSIVLSGSNSSQTAPTTGLAVSTSGQITTQAGVSNGDNYANATYNGLTSQMHFYIRYQKNIAFPQPTVTLISGGTYQLYVRDTYNDGYFAVLPATSYAVASGSGFTVSSSGLVTATSSTATSGTITATYSGPETASPQTTSENIVVNIPVLQNWYVRTNGGTPSQCNGHADVDYSSGASPNCALNDPRYLESPGDASAYAQRMIGGDQLLIHGGPYRMGASSAAGCVAFAGSCDAANAMFTPPAGSVANPTKILGENYATCSTGYDQNRNYVGGANTTQLFGGFSLNVVLNLQGTNNVRLQCLELTDHSQCSNINQYPSPCKTDGTEDYANNGIATDLSSYNLTTQDVNVHGFRGSGIIGPEAGLFTAIRTRLAFNSSAGWNLDSGNTFSIPSSNAQNNWSYVLIEGNGCIEQYPIVNPVFPAAYCNDDGDNGYGDGVGTDNSPNNFAVDHSTFRYNTQDGFDVLHTYGSTISITNSQSYGNEGQQLKFGAMQSVLVQNNLIITNCNRMSKDIPGGPTSTGAVTDWNHGLADICRAGAGIQNTHLGTSAGNPTYRFYGNTILGYSVNYMFEVDSCSDGIPNQAAYDCTVPVYYMQNNIWKAYPNPMSGNQYILSHSPAAAAGSFLAVSDHNIFSTMQDCPTETGSSCGDPHLAGEPASPTAPNTFLPETAFDSLVPLATQMQLTSASTNAIGKGASIAGLTTDYAGNARSATAPSIGAFEYVAPLANPPVITAPSGPPSSTPVTPSCSVSGSPCNGGTWASSNSNIMAVTNSSTGAYRLVAPGQASLVYTLNGTNYVTIVYTVGLSILGAFPITPHH